MSRLIGIKATYDKEKTFRSKDVLVRRSRRISLSTLLRLYFRQILATVSGKYLI